MDAMRDVVSSAAGKQASTPLQIQKELSNKDRLQLGAKLIYGFDQGRTRPPTVVIGEEAVKALITAARELRIKESDLINKDKQPAIVDKLAELCKLKGQRKVVERALAYALDSGLLEKILKEEQLVKLALAPSIKILNP